MRKNIIPWKNSILLRLILTFLFIMIPVYTLGVLIYNWGVSTVKMDITNTMLAQSVSFNAQLEGDIRRARGLMNDCLVSRNSQMLANASDIMDTYERSRSVNELQDRLMSIMKSCGFSTDASLHIAPIGKSISAIGGFGGTQEKKLHYFVQFSKGQQGFVEWQGRLFLLSVDFAEWLDSDDMPDLLIEMEISKQKLKGMLNNLNTYKESGSLLIFDNIQGVISTGGDANTIDSVINAVKNLPKEQKKGSFRIVTGKERLIVVFARVENSAGTVVKYVPESIVTSSAGNYSFWYWILTGVSLLVIIIYCVFTYRKINKPLYSLVQSFRKMEEGDLKTRIGYERKDEFGYLFHSFNRMVDKLDELVNQVYVEKILAQKAELKQLQAQINPHFLYNSFFTLQRTIIGEEIDKAALYAEKLGSYFKYITRNQQEEVALEKEVEHARIFADIQSMRFSRRIKIEFGYLPEECFDWIVPRLILQPLLENAFEHGLKSSEKGGLLKVSFNIVSENDSVCYTERAEKNESVSVLHIIVEDNGSDFDEGMASQLSERLDNPGEDGEITALINIHRRLKLRFAPPSGLYIFKGPLGGMQVVLKIREQKEGKPC